jgi:enolase-phosphatase E1
VLFPYSVAHIEEFLREHADEEGVESELDELQDLHSRDQRGNLPVPPWPRADWIASGARYARWLIREDRKSPPLKALQGRVWKAGYESGELVGQLYPDVPEALERWHKQKRRVAIFSSGSVLAQRLLFRHSTAGDLSAFIDAYFDTATGPKNDPDSFRAIARELEVPPPRVLFLSDSSAELNAAASAGMPTRLSLRMSGVDQPANAAHQAVTSFEDLATTV